MPTERPRITITMSEEQLEQVKVFQHNNRMNQTQAILHLVELGFAEIERQNDSPKKEKAPKPDNSDSEAKVKEQTIIIKALLESAGVTGDISDNDLAFLQGIVLAVKAHFKERDKSLK